MSLDYVRLIKTLQDYIDLLKSRQPENVGTTDNIKKQSTLALLTMTEQFNNFQNNSLPILQNLKQRIDAMDIILTYSVQTQKEK